VGGFKKERGTFSLSFKGNGGLFIILIRSCKTAELIVFASASISSCYCIVDIKQGMDWLDYEHEYEWG
jgi:hypothetical protein